MRSKLKNLLLVYGVSQAVCCSVAVAQFGISYGDQVNSVEIQKIQSIETPKERLAQIDNLLTKYPENPSVLALRAQTLEELALYKEAESDISKAIKLRPNRDEWLLGRARIYLKMGELEKASDDCNQAFTTLGTRTWGAWSLKSKILLAQGKNDEAVKCAQESLFNLASMGLDRTCDPSSSSIVSEFNPVPRKVGSSQLLNACSQVAKLKSPPDENMVTKLVAELITEKIELPPRLNARLLKVQRGDSENEIRLYPDVDTITITQEDVSKKFPVEAVKEEGLGSPGGPEKSIRVLDGNCLITFLFHFRGFEPLTEVIFQWKKGADPS